jgi:hypothetical protein
LALPQKIPVKITSEAAGYVSFTPVARQELTPAELVAQILVVTGKRLSRIRDILSRGSFVSGSSRFRWEPLDADSGELEALLAPFPDEDPGRPFDPAYCTMVVFKGLRGAVEVVPEAAAKRRLLKKTSFWDAIMALFETAQPTYHRYSYSERADVYQVKLPIETLQTILDQTNLLKYASIAQELRFLEPNAAELFAKRP